MILSGGATPGLGAAYDFIVVGGGAAGCVVARRLAEDRSANVLLIEAGPSDIGVGAITRASAWVGLLGGRYDYGYRYAPNPRLDGRAIAAPRGKVLGGSSAINAMLWYRGHPSDYDAWSEAGCAGWSYNDVLPFFRRSEDHEGGATRYRGADGPMRIERGRDPHPIAVAMLEGATDLGLPVIDDANAGTNEGATLADFNMRRDERWSAARGYLHPAAAWPNLSILVDSAAVGLVFEAGACVGVRHVVEGAVVTTRAEREVVLTLGAFETPRLLIRSGIGDPEDLRGLGVPTRVDLPGVGRNLRDHPLLMGVNFRARRPLGQVRGNGGGAMLNWRSRADLPAPDLHAFVVQGSHAGPEIAAAHDLSGDIFAISPGLMRSKSVGALRLLDAEPGGRMLIDPAFLAEPDDFDALLAGLDMVWELAHAAAYRDLMAGPAAPARRLTRAEKIAFVRASCSTFFHPCGTCAMGVGAMAVVDPTLRVHGVERLRVGDASVMPLIPSCNTQAPTIMIAERAADFMRGDDSARCDA
jgi:choline dehydrogenase